MHGRKPLIMMGLAGFVVSMICCGFVVAAGVRHLAAPMLIFALFLIARALFGLFGSAANPATQAYLAERTSRGQAHRRDGQPGRRLRPGHHGRPAAGAAVRAAGASGLAGPMFGFALLPR